MAKPAGKSFAPLPNKEICVVEFPSDVWTFWSSQYVLAIEMSFSPLSGHNYYDSICLVHSTCPLYRSEMYRGLNLDTPLRGIPFLSCLHCNIHAVINWWTQKEIER